MLDVTINSFSYPENDEILRNIRFNLATNAHLAILGESGCGKSTLLHLIYGLLDLENGVLTWKNKPILGPKDQLVPGAPFIKLVAQQDNVMPYTTVTSNITEFLPRLNLKQDLERANELMELVGLANFAKTKVKTLSGGQKQRVAIAKALAKEPELLLLDEPFAHIDEFRKSRLRRNLYGHLKQQGIGCITATHDASEALSFADYVLILEQGRVSFYGTPQVWYNNISSAYQDGFFGEINELTLDNESTKFVFPHKLVVSKSKTKIKAKVVTSYFKGSHYLIQAIWNKKPLFFEHKTALEPTKYCFLDLLD